MKKIKLLALWGILIALISCANDQANEDIPLSEPDKVVENLDGTLYYVEVIKQWAVRYYYPGTIDSVDIYLLNDFDPGNTPADARLKVKISGKAYKATDDLFPVHAGTTVYRIVITNILYE